MFKRFVSLAALALSLSISAQAADLTAWSPQIEAHPTTVALRSFLGEYQKITGETESRIIPTAEFKDQAKLLESIRKGQLGVAVLTGSAIGRMAPMADVMRLPFILKNTQQMFGYLEGELGQDMDARMRAQGIVLLGWYDGGARAFYSRSKLGSVAELKDVKIRVPSRQDLKSLVSSLGGTPLDLPYKDVNAAFESGRIDAAENDLLSYQTEQHFKRAKYYYPNNNHSVQFEALVVSKLVWDKLSDAQRSAVMAAGKASARLDRDIWVQRTASARKLLEKEGVTFVQYGDSSVLLSRVAAIYKPYMHDPATSALLLRLMTTRI